MLYEAISGVLPSGAIAGDALQRARPVPCPSTSVSRTSPRKMEKRRRKDEKRARECEIEKRLRAGEPVASIAASTGLSRSVIYARRKKLDLIG